MSAKTIKSALGVLQDDPDQEKAWQTLREDVGASADMSAEDLRKLLEAARRAHDARREHDAVARLLVIEADAARGTPREADLVAELARTLDEDLLDDEGARGAYERLLALRPTDANAQEAIERSEAKRGKWHDLVDRYVQEAHSSGDEGFRSSLLVSAAEVTYRFGGEKDRKRVEPLLREALDLDVKNRRGELLLERLLRGEGRWEDLTKALSHYAAESTQKEEKIAALQRLARVLRTKLQQPARAVEVYETLLDFVPGLPEATSFLADHFTTSEQWEHLVALYEGQLSSGALRGKDEEFGAVLQIAMVHWRMRNRPDAAEPWFERLRKLEPANAGMLSFFREWCTSRGETTRLAAVLTEAQRATPEGPERSALGTEIAKLAEVGANAQKAIEQWRTLLRQDPRNVDARTALKRLYRQTAGWNALTDLLRQELERLPQDDVPGRLVVLREIGDLYRDHVKSDSALVTVLSQIVQLAPDDLGSVRELARVYEALQRWRDLLTTQARQAELEPEAGTKAELWRAIARRWLEQFSNVQNAVDAYEKLRAVVPADREAIDRLKELYVKRRAYKPLYELLADEAAGMEASAARRDLWTEMAKLAAERLDMGAQAVALYKKVLDEEPSSTGALDALEKQAERDKDFATVADVLERRASVAPDDATRLNVLQKLGAVYSDRLHDHEKAMSAWRRVLGIQPGHAKALRVLRDSLLAVGDYDGLAELYAQTHDWEGLVDVLSSAADKSTDAQLKIDLSFRCAAIYVERIGAPERAFRAYERVLSVRPEDLRAASALVPLYEKEEKWGRLPALYEVLLAQTEAVEGKLAVLDKLVRVTGHQLQDRVSAYNWARKAYELAPGREGALAAFEEAARAASQWEGFVEALSARLASGEPAQEQGTRAGKKKRKKDRDPGEGGRREELRALRAKLAQVYAREMGRVDEAVATYRALVEEDDGDDLAVQTLDRILRESDRRDDLRWLFNLRVERANTAHKLELLGEWAMLEEEAFGAPDRAVALYRRLLEIVPQHGAALRALARLLRSQGDAQGAVDVLALDRDQREGSERAAREVEMARLLVDPLRKPALALSACERALQLSPNDPSAIEVVEQLLPTPETRAQAARILEASYEQTGAFGRQADVLEVLIATTAAREDRLALYGRLADVHENRLGDAGAAFDVVARAAGEFPTELALWDRLAVLAAKTGRAQALVEAIVAVVPASGAVNLPEHVELDLAERAATLFDEKLGDVDRARPYLERMLSRNPGNERAFQRLKQILTTREQWGELADLYERVVAATPDPPRRAELLAEVALVAEEITGERGKAIAYYERILELDALHDQAVRSLDSLYAAEQRWDSLARLLERRLESAVGDEKLDLELRLGTLLFGRIGNASAALAYLEHVLRERPAAAEARQLVEKILDVPELRSRAAIILEAVYTERDEVPELVRVLEIHLEFASNADERRDLLRRVAELRDERLRDDPGALEAFARLLPLDPEDSRARQRMLEIARRLGAHERAAGVLTATAAAAAAPMPRAEILMDVARLYENQLGDVGRADAVYRQVLQLAPDDANITLPACRSLERIYSASGDSQKLCDVLRLQVPLEDDAAARKEIRGRLADLCETVLDDPRGAIEAWRARLEDDPGDAQALAALDRLYERTQSFRELVDVLRARERSADDKDARRALLVRIATTLADKLADVPEAILAYRTVVDDFGADRASLSSLSNLYELADRWQDLADALEADLALADGPGDKLAILARLGEVRQRRLKDISGSLEAYRQALVLEPSHPGCRAALEAMLQDPAAQREAASLLRPLYEADGLHQKLLTVLDIEIEAADSTSDKLSTIAQAAQVAEGPLGAAEVALGYAARGLRESVAEPELPRWIERVERLAEATGKYAQLVELLRASVGEILDGELQLEVTLRIAEVARTRLGDPALAKEFYVKALDLRADERRALIALESLYEETGENAALLDIVKRRADAAESDQERRQLLFKQASLCDEKLGDLRAAIGVYEQILDLALDPAAIAALERLYVRSERWEDLVALYERQIAAAGASNEHKAALHHALGSTLEQRMHEVERSFDEYAAALAIDPKHPQTVASLEALMGTRDHAARAAEMLEPVYLARLDWRRVMKTLEARLDASQDPDERRQLLRRLSKMHEEQEENYGAALEMTAKLLAEDLTDEGTWAELERLARVANAEARLAEIFAGELAKINSDEPVTARLSRRTGELFEAQKDVDRALVFYRRAYAFDPEASDGTFEAIDRLLRSAGRASERVALFRASLDFKQDPKERLKALHTIASIEDGELHDDAAAIETYRAALEVDEEDRDALEALGRLYSRTDRFRDLAELTRRRAEQSALPEDEARFRMDLAKLSLEKLGEAQAGIDELQAVVELAAPGSAPAREAVAELEKLLQVVEHKARVVDILRPIYERADDWRHLVSVNDERLSLATDDGERIAVLRETARLWEERGKDLDRAFEAMRSAWILDPEDGDARENLDRLAEATKRWDDLAGAYEVAVAKTDGVARRELLAALANLHDKRRDDPRKALDAWERLFALDETELSPLEEMDALATLLSDWSSLVRVLTRKAELVPDDETRASTWRRVGEAKRDMLEDLAGATDAYERALELEATSAFTMDNLIALYEQKGDAARLVDLYRRRVELCGAGDEDLKFQLLLEAARRFEVDLSDRREAIECLNQALAVRASDPEVLKRLDALYTHERLWPELLDNLKLQAGAAQDPDARRALRKRVAALHAVEMQDPQSALDAYREVLEAGFDAEAAAAVQGIGETHEELRLDAAEVLEPVLRAAGRHAELAAVLELRLRAQTEAPDRARTLRALAEVAETSLGDVDRAESALLRALAEEPQDATLHGDIERLAEKLGSQGFRRYADALQERAAGLFDANVAADLFSRLGRVSESKLDDPARAAKAYVAAAERTGDDPVVLVALDRLFVRLGDSNALADVLERRIALESQPAARADLLHRLASLQIGEFKERSQGLATLRMALETQPDHTASRRALEQLLEDDALFDDAFDALEFVLRALGLSEDLAALYERRVTRAHTPRDRGRARLELAKVLEERVGDLARAQRAVEAAVREEPTDEDALTELERLAAANAGWAQAVDALAAALEAATDLSAATRTELWIRLAGWSRDRLEDRQRAESAFARALAIDPENLDVLRSIEQIRRAPGRERELVETLRARARLETDLATKRELLREAKGVAEATLGDRELAEATLRDLIAEDEGDLWAIEELSKLRMAAGDDAELVKLLLRRAELVVDGAGAIALKHEAAKVLAERLHDVTRATALYEEILEGEPTDAEAARVLRRLYAEGERYKDLAKLLTRLIDVAESQEPRAKLRLELAELQNQRFKAPDDAIETLRALMDEDPSHAQGALLLSQVFEQTGRDAELADLLKAQLDSARDRSDQGAELALLVRLAEVQEGRLSDMTAATEAYEQVLVRDPMHRPALEAVARIAEKRSDWERAAGALAKLVELSNDADGVPWALRLAEAREKLGDAAGAEDALQQGLRLDTANTRLREMLRARWEKAGKWAELAELLVGDADLVAAANPGARVEVVEVPVKASVPPARAGNSMPPPAVVPAPIAEQVKLLRAAADIHLLKRSRPEDAIPVLERAAQLVPQDRELLLVLCDAYSAAQRGGDAAQVLERVIASFGSKRTKELALYHHRLARALSQLGQKDVALTQLDLAFKIDPGSVTVLRDLGVLAFETNDLDRAQKTFRALLLQRLDNNAGISKGEVFYYLGEISAKQGDKTKAVQMFERAIENDPALERARTKLTELKQ
jgi:tetratricopeptide (TPR) repeat protein